MSGIEQPIVPRIELKSANAELCPDLADYHLPLRGFQMKKIEQEESSQTQLLIALNLGIPFEPALIPVCANLQSATLEL
jgi:hypothetical protein